MFTVVVCKCISELVEVVKKIVYFKSHKRHVVFTCKIQFCSRLRWSRTGFCHPHECLVRGLNVGQHRTIPLFGHPLRALRTLNTPGSPPKCLWSGVMFEIFNNEDCVDLPTNQNRSEPAQCTGPNGLNTSSASHAPATFCHLKIPPQISKISSGGSDASTELLLRTWASIQRLGFIVSMDDNDLCKLGLITVGPWATWGLGAPMPHAIKNPCMTFDSPKT